MEPHDGVRHSSPIPSRNGAGNDNERGNGLSENGSRPHFDFAEIFAVSSDPEPEENTGRGASRFSRFFQHDEPEESDRRKFIVSRRFRIPGGSLAIVCKNVHHALFFSP
jgi:hypothetical protein